MSKKKDNNETSIEPEDVDPVEVDSQEAVPASRGDEAVPAAAAQADGEAVQSAEAEAAMEELSPDDLLEDVRRSLIVDTVAEEQVQESKWWKRLGKGAKKPKPTAVAPPELAGPSVERPPEEEKETAQDEYVGQLDNLIDMLAVEGDKTAIVEWPAKPVPDAIPEPEQKEQEKLPDLNELKKRAFHARTTPEAEEENISEVRTIAMEDGQEVFIEVEAKKEDTYQDRLKAFENTLKPYRRYFYFLFVFVSLVMILLVSASVYRLYQRSLPPPPTEEAVLLPYPVAVNLPGGLQFHLGKGELEEGNWEPRGPEWLEGTEVCRWIAIPYSRQMEAVVLTLSREDQIELVMSNNDVLRYNVNSREQLSIEEMEELYSNSPCVLVMLAQSGEEKRWVVNAVP